MNNTLKDILEMDKKAKELLNQVEEYRRVSIATIDEKKEQIISEETQKARESAMRHSNNRKAEGNKYLEEVKNRNTKIIEKFDTLYKENADRWVQAIVDEVTAD